MLTVLHRSNLQWSNRKKSVFCYFISNWHCLPKKKSQYWLFHVTFECGDPKSSSTSSRRTSYPLHFTSENIAGWIPITEAFLRCNKSAHINYGTIFYVFNVCTCFHTAKMKGLMPLRHACKVGFPALQFSNAVKARLTERGKINSWLYYAKPFFAWTRQEFAGVDLSATPVHLQICI